MRKPMRRPVAVVLLALVASLLGVVTPGTAYAAESIPTLQWSPPANVSTTGAAIAPVTAPNGNITLPCTRDGSTGSDLRTYSSTGQLVQSISRTQTIDGVRNCITNPVVDKTGAVYGRPIGRNSSGAYDYGPNLLAYNGNTLKWKYPVCNVEPAVGADGNIYALTQAADGTHLIGLAPNLASGQTQPTKVRDFKVSADCDYVLRPYKDGIALSYPHVDDRPQYYSYSGKYLGQASIGDWGSDAFGAEGRFFSPTYTWSADNVKSAAVSMYDPRKGATTWTTQVSTPGANVQGSLQLHTINNGVVAIIYEWKMVSEHVPVTPTEWVFTVVTLDNNGHEIRRVTLPNQEAQGKYQAASLGSAADASGMVAILRNMNLSTGDSANPTASGIFVGVYDAVNGTWFYQKVMSGDMSKAGGPNGYRLYLPPVITNNILAFVAACNGNCSDYNPKLYAVKMTGIGMDYPRGAILSATVSAQPAPRSYMALGDSFSSGEGVPPFVDDTACHRSALAYSRVNALNPSLTLQLDKFVACSGAQTTHVLNGWDDAGHSEPSQVSVLSSGSPKVVTITIGGNDIGFADFAEACVLSSCKSGSTAYTDADSKIKNVLPANLEATYKKLLEVTKTSGTKIYVLGYPQVIADKSGSTLSDPRCGYMYNNDASEVSAQGYPWADAWAARDIVTKLNTTISNTVTKVRALSTDNQRLNFVSATASGSPFIGHEICASGDSYFHNVDQAGNNSAYVFHPNEQGQAAYAQLVRQAIGE